MEMKKVFDSIRPTRSLKPEPGSFRELCYNLVVPCHRNPTACGREHHEVHSKFESVMTTIIVLNVLVISLTHYGQSQEYEAWIEGLNVFFLCLYTLEMAAKIIALTTHTYLNSLWNMFDGFLVFAGWLSLIVSSVAPDFNSSFLLLLRALRLLRGLQLIRRVRGLRVLTEALVSSIPALANVSGLLLLMFFIYAIFGVSLFGTFSWRQTRRKVAARCIGGLIFGRLTRPFSCFFAAARAKTGTRSCCTSPSTNPFGVPSTSTRSCCS